MIRRSYVWNEAALAKRLRVSANWLDWAIRRGHIAVPVQDRQETPWDGETHAGECQETEMDPTIQGKTRLCQCGAVLKPRQRMCVDCRLQNRRRTIRRNNKSRMGRSTTVNRKKVS